MKIIQNYAQWNRKAMIYEIVKGMKLHIIEQFTTIHNYIDTDTMILRKRGCICTKTKSCLFLLI